MGDVGHMMNLLIGHHRLTEGLSRARSPYSTEAPSEASCWPVGDVEAAAIAGSAYCRCPLGAQRRRSQPEVMKHQWPSAQCLQQVLGGVAFLCPSQAIANSPQVLTGSPGPMQGPQAQSSAQGLPQGEPDGRSPSYGSDKDTGSQSDSQARCRG